MTSKKCVMNDVKHVMTSTKFVMTSKIRHDVYNTSWRQKGASWRPRHDMTSKKCVTTSKTRNNVIKCVMTSKTCMTSKGRHFVRSTSWTQHIRHGVTSHSHSPHSPHSPPLSPTPFPSLTCTIYVQLCTTYSLPHSPYPPPLPLPPPLPPPLPTHTIYYQLYTT